jgi:fructose-1,6-bisphosphatase I
MITTLSEFILDRQSDFPYATGELTRLLADIGIASKIVNQEVNRAGLGDILGAHGSENVQGEQQQKLDVFADETFIRAFRHGGQVCGIASEEQTEYVAFQEDFCRDGKYVVLFDPLDGSSNIDVNVSIGTIFSIFRRKSSAGSPANLKDFLQKGSEQVAAGYVLYGSSTMLVYTTGKGVNGFTLEPGIGEFCLSHPDMKIPETGKIYSINEGNWEVMGEGLRNYVRECRRRELRGRYIGSLVADFHRNMIKGGIYVYPGINSAPNGKLRLMYECAPLAFIAEQAGGLATDGYRRIMDIAPDELHQRVPFFVGSKRMVEEAMACMAEAKKVQA